MQLEQTAVTDQDEMAAAARPLAALLLAAAAAAASSRQLPAAVPKHYRENADVAKHVIRELLRMEWLERHRLSRHAEAIARAAGRDVAPADLLYLTEEDVAEIGAQLSSVSHGST